MVPNVCDIPESDNDDNADIHDSVEAGPSHQQLPNEASVAPDNNEGHDKGQDQDHSDLLQLGCR